MNPQTRTVLIAGGSAIALLVGVPLIWGAVAGWPSWGWGMMGPGMMWGGFGMGFGALFMVVFWGLIIWAVVALAQGPSRTDGTGEGLHFPESALAILKRRYALGEISKEEYEEKKRDLA